MHLQKEIWSIENCPYLHVNKHQETEVKTFYILFFFKFQKSAENQTSLCLQYEVVYCIKPDARNNGGGTSAARVRAWIYGKFSNN